MMERIYCCTSTMDGEDISNKTILEIRTFYLEVNHASGNDIEWRARDSLAWSRMGH